MGVFSFAHVFFICVVSCPPLCFSRHTTGYCIYQQILQHLQTCDLIFQICCDTALVFFGDFGEETVAEICEIDRLDFLHCCDLYSRDSVVRLCCIGACELSSISSDFIVLLAVDLW